ncbi:Phosphopantetheine attachment site [Leminorella richardii]|uniref:Phosphopantetheine attachment site n=1 Tax=Leminorella richardii TaxID=158841 RepID=A0A2X4Y089_9GAMM|nr:acyl carrier protein [Leminorella richardii]SQI42184.1 Phosphopantetheine attachment site [Leminorella richardii]
MDYLQQSKTILSNCLSVPVDRIEADSTLEQLKPGLDSVTFASMMMEVERLLKKEVPAAQWLDLETAADLAAILERNWQE